MRVAGQPRWQETWRIVGRPGAVRIELARGRGARASSAALGGLPAGTPVVLSAPAPGAIRACRRAAARAGVAVEREYLAFPSATAPAYLVEAVPGPVRVFTREVLVAPPRPGAVPALSAAVALARAVRSWRLMRALAPGALVVGKRL
jgi:hypothetical protein